MSDAYGKMSCSAGMLASPSRVSGFAALCASLGLHAVVLGLVVAGTLELPDPSDAAAWSGSTFEISTFQEPARGVSASAAAAVPASAAATGSTEAAEESGKATEAVSAEAKPVEQATAPDEGEPSENAPRVPVPAVEAQKRPDKAPTPARPTPASSGEAAHSKANEPAGAQSAAELADSQGSHGSASTPGGAFGAEGVDARKGSLPDAFTRALPMAARGSAWRALPQGPAGRFIVVVDLDGEGAVEKLTPLGSQPAHVQELTRSLQILLRSGRFAAPAEGDAHAYRLGVTALIDQTTASAEPDAAPDLVKELSFQKLSPGKPGVATLIYNSGRRVRFEVVVDPKWTVQ